MSVYDTGRGGANSATKIKFLSLNANSIGKNPKRQKVFNHIKKRNPDFILVCDTRICQSIESMVRDEWGGQCVFNSFSSQARGVAIFLKKNNPAKIIDSFSDTDGNLLAISLLYEEKKILLEVLYGPNQDTPNFYSEIVFKQIQAWNPDFSIFAGDYNVVLDHALDTKNYQHENNPFAREALKNQMHQYNLVDIWRELHPDGKQYTWRKFNENKQSRLDYFLISASLLPYVQNASIIPSYCSDHSGI